MSKAENISSGIITKEPAFDRHGVQVGHKIHCQNGATREIHDTLSFCVKTKKDQK